MASHLSTGQGKKSHYTSTSHTPLFFHYTTSKINGKWCIHIVPLSKALYNVCALHSHMHSYTDGRGNHARHQPAHQEQLGVQSLAQGLFDTNSGGARDPTGNPSGTLRVLMTVSLPLSHCSAARIFEYLPRCKTKLQNACEDQENTPRNVHSFQILLYLPLTKNNNTLTHTQRCAETGSGDVHLTCHFYCVILMSGVSFYLLRTYSVASHLSQIL